MRRGARLDTHLPTAKTACRCSCVAF